METQQSAEVLKIEGLRKSFGSLEVIKGVDLSVRRGEVVTILGASGSGKSTLLRCVNFLETPTAGRLSIEGAPVGRLDGDRMIYDERELCRLRTKVGMVFQQFNLFPHLTVLENVTLGPMKLLGVAPDKARQAALMQLDRVGIAHKADEHPSRLSGGQQQRVAIARALAMNPVLMLFDEATSALDPELVGEILLAMRQLAADGMTMLVVTHELGFAYNVASRVVFLHGGVIHEEGPPQEVLGRPKGAYTRAFLEGHTLFRLPEQSAAAGHTGSGN
jgi:polar amino acid transport system ATP-binding protein